MMKKKNIIIVCLTLIFVAFSSLSAYAEDEEFIYTPNANSVILESALENAGYSETTIYAILGNISVATCGRFDPTIVNGVCDSDSTIEEFPNDGAIGLAQWTGARKDNLKAFADAEQTSPLDINTQVRFLLKEMNDNGFTPENLNKYSLEQSTYIIFRRYLAGSNDAPLSFGDYVNSLDANSSATANYGSALSIAKNRSGVLSADVILGVGAQYGPSCNPILPSNANTVYGLKSGDVKTHGDIGVIRACMNKFMGTSFSTTNNTYDQQLADAVTRFQKNKGIWSSGINGRVGKATRCAICKALYPSSSYPASYNNYCTRASNCGGSSVPTTPTQPTTPTAPTSPTAVGVQSTSGYAKQSDYGKVYWKYNKTTWTSKSSVSTSGCSFIATVNALKRLGVVGNVNTYVKNLAAWTLGRDKSNPPKQSSNPEKTKIGKVKYDGRWTAGGWDKIKLIINNYSTLKSKVGYRTLSLSGSADNKLKQVRNELSKGNALIFYGKSGAPYTSGGHYVTVIGITKDNKVVVTNAASGSSTVAYKTFFSRSYSSPYVIYKK